MGKSGSFTVMFKIMGSVYENLFYLVKKIFITNKTCDSFHYGYKLVWYYNFLQTHVGFFWRRAKIRWEDQ